MKTRMKCHIWLSGGSTPVPWNPRRLARRKVRRWSQKKRLSERPLWHQNWPSWQETKRNGPTKKWSWKNIEDIRRYSTKNNPIDSRQSVHGITQSTYFRKPQIQSTARFTPPHSQKKRR